MSKEILREGDTVYAQEPGPYRPAQWLAVSNIDWLALAKQKRRLTALIWKDDNDILWGLVDLLDVIQDQAAEDGHPVVFFHDAKEWDDEHGGSVD